ncbi:hypothetical protein [Thiocapsa sp.]|uniref:hypothetical protein n=1 Tax=Thiocapsa sp. TaxID=2024551 RepID=UPI003593C1BB
MTEVIDVSAPSQTGPLIIPKERTPVAAKEATARFKINKLLETAGWRFFSKGGKPANIRLEPSVTIKASDLDALGNNFEKAVK